WQQQRRAVVAAGAGGQAVPAAPAPRPGVLRRQQRVAAQQALGQAQPAAPGPMVPNGVVVFLQATPETEVRVTTPRGEFRFSPARARYGQPTTYLDGRASVERVAADFKVTDQPTEDDFPAAVSGPDGSVWVTYVTYRY